MTTWQEKKEQLDEIIIERFARRWPKFPRISYIVKEKNQAKFLNYSDEDRTKKIFSQRAPRGCMGGGGYGDFTVTYDQSFRRPL